MIITAKANGDILNIKPSVFYQGSTEANKIYLIAPFAISSSVNVSFTLPNTTDIAATLMTPSTAISDTLNTWVYDVPVAITQYVGIVKVNISITTPTGTIITLNRCQFEVKRGDEVVLPDEPEADVYASIVQALADIYANFINKVDTNYTDTENEIEQSVINNVNGLKLVKTVGDVTVTFEVTEDGIEIDGVEINTNIENRIETHNTSGTAHADIRLIAETAEANSEEAVATANEAKETAENAETVALGIDAKATEALENSEDAVETADEAKTIALSKTNNKSFDTYAEMIAYISNADNKELHTVGSSFFIVDTEVPDYWVIEVLTTPNESGYYYVLEETESSVLSVNGQTGEVVLDADDIDDSEATNKFITAEELAQIAINTENILTNTENIEDLQNEKVSDVKVNDESVVSNNVAEIRVPQYMGTYDDETQYYTGDTVIYNSVPYFAKQNTIGNAPPIRATLNSDYWQGPENVGKPYISGGYLVDSDKYLTFTQGTNDYRILSQESSFKVSSTNEFEIPFKTNITGDLTVTGDIIQSGSAYETHAEQIYSTKDEIILRDGAVSGLADGSMAKITAKFYDGINDGVLGFDNNGIAKVGDVGSEQAIATREDAPTDTGVARWDNTTFKFITETPDSTPTTDSTKLVTSGGVKTQLDTKSNLATENTFTEDNIFEKDIKIGGNIEDGTYSKNVQNIVRGTRIIVWEEED